MWLQFSDDPEVGTHAVEHFEQPGLPRAEDLDRFRSVTVSSEPPHSPSEVTWHFDLATKGPHSGAVDLAGLLFIVAYEVPDVEAMVQFDARTTERFSTYFEQYGELNAGTFTCPQLGDNWIVEVSGYVASDPAEADAMLDRIDELPGDIQAIIDECRQLQHRDRPRYSFWLVPR